jgi:hypothetical protein
VGPRPKADASAQANYAQPVYAAQTQQAVPTRTEPAIQGTLVPGATLAEKLAWLQRSADSHNTYVLEVSADENIAHYTFEYKGAINITVVLKGIGSNRTIRLLSNERMFTVKQNVTFILDNNITLMGHNGNGHHIVNVEGGTFKMNAGATITGNTGGGVYNNGTFTMSGGTISSNNAKNGSGIYNDETFTMSGGTIFGNNASERGGGVYNSGTFTMSGGTISGNNATYGGGVYAGGKFQRGKFIISGGTITSNTAREYGGGVNMANGWYAWLTMRGGTITGYNSDQSNGNVVKDENGVISRRGHAVYINEKNKRKETTAGPGANLSSDGSGGWDE